MALFLPEMSLLSRLWICPHYIVNWCYSIGVQCCEFSVCSITTKLVSLASLEGTLTFCQTNVLAKQKDVLLLFCLSFHRPLIYITDVLSVTVDCRLTFGSLSAVVELVVLGQRTTTIYNKASASVAAAAAVVVDDDVVIVVFSFQESETRKRPVTTSKIFSSILAGVLVASRSLSCAEVEILCFSVSVWISKTKKNF